MPRRAARPASNPPRGVEDAEGERGVVDDVDAAVPLAEGLGVGGEPGGLALVAGEVARVEQDGGGERDVEADAELGEERGLAAGVLVREAARLVAELGGVDGDALDLVGVGGPAWGACALDRGARGLEVVAGGVGLDREGLDREPLAEVGEHAGEGPEREPLPEALAVLEDVGGAGHAGAREVGGLDADLRRHGGGEELRGRLEERGLERERGLRERDRERVGRLLGGEAEQRGGGGGGADEVDERPHLAVERPEERGAADPAGDLVGDDDGGEEVAAGPAFCLSDGERGEHGGVAGVADPDDVVEVLRHRERGVDERGGRGGHALSVRDHGRRPIAGGERGQHAQGLG